MITRKTKHVLNRVHANRVFSFNTLNSGDSLRSSENIVKLLYFVAGSVVLSVLVLCVLGDFKKISYLPLPLPHFSVLKKSPTPTSSDTALIEEDGLSEYVSGNGGEKLLMTSDEDYHVGNNRHNPSKSAPVALVHTGGPRSDKKPGKSFEVFKIRRDNIKIVHKSAGQAAPAQEQRNTDLAKAHTEANNNRSADSNNHGAIGIEKQVVTKTTHRSADVVASAVEEMDRNDLLALNLCFETKPQYQTSGWENPKIKINYRVTIVDTWFVEGARPCRRAELQRWIDGAITAEYLVACRNSLGGWEHQFSQLR